MFLTIELMVNHTERHYFKRLLTEEVVVHPGGRYHKAKRTQKNS